MLRATVPLITLLLGICARQGLCYHISFAKAILLRTRHRSQHSASPPRVWTTSALRSTRTQSVATPGSPVVQSVDNSTLTAVISVAVDGDATNRAFNEACRSFNEQVRSRNMTIPGFTANSPLPPYLLFELFEKSKVIDACAYFLQEQIAEQINLVPLPLMGNGKVVDFHRDRFKPGRAHVLELACDLWPPIRYRSTSAYRGLHVVVDRPANFTVQVEAVKLSLLEKQRVFEPIDDTEHRLALGDACEIDLEAFLVDEHGQRTVHLNERMTNSTGLRVILQPERHMTGLVEGLLGAQCNERRTISVRFPSRSEGAGASLSHLPAEVDATVRRVFRTHLPSWSQEVADEFKSGLSLQALEEEIANTVEANDADLEARRNGALSRALLEVIDMPVVPPRMVDSQLLDNFEGLLREYIARGLSDTELQQLATDKNYEIYTRLHRNEVQDSIRLGFAFRDIAAKERISVTEAEMQQQLSSLLKSLHLENASQINEAQARQEIESVLLRRKVFEALKSLGSIEYRDVSEPPKPANEGDLSS